MWRKKVPRNWINEAGDYVTEEFVNYIRPLIQAELDPDHDRRTSKTPVLYRRREEVRE